MENHGERYEGSCDLLLRDALNRLIWNAIASAGYHMEESLLVVIRTDVRSPVVRYRIEPYDNITEDDRTFKSQTRTSANSSQHQGAITKFVLGAKKLVGA